MPRILRSVILKFSGKTAPTCAQGTLTPTPTLLAPQIICNGSGKPTSTLHNDNLSASGCLTHSVTKPTTIPLNSGATG